MENELRELLGCKVNIGHLEKPYALPVYMAMRKIECVEIDGFCFALIDIIGERDLSVSAMKKQRAIYEDALQMPVAYQLRADSLAMRNALVKNRVSFISLPENLYLPFLGIALQDIYRETFVKTDKMMPATQMVFLELLYRNTGEGLLKNEVARKLNLTKTSITRATAQLEGMGLIQQDKSGTGIRIQRNYPQREYFERAKKNLINPVKKIIEARKEEMSGLYSAGESALSQGSSLNPPQIEEMAIYKGADWIEQLIPADSRYEEKASCMKVQLWKYDPAYFARDGKVDPVSLVCSFADKEDERIEMCIEELLEVLQ